MGVGDSLEFPYELPGPLPAGRYLISVIGDEPTADATVHFDLLWRASGAADQPIGQADARADDHDAGLTGGSVGAKIEAAAVPAHCGDSLVLRAQVVSGGSAYLDFLVQMTTP